LEASVTFTQSFIDPATGSGFYKAKVFDQFTSDTYRDVGATKDTHFYLYRYAEQWRPYPIFTLPAGLDCNGFEQAAVADINGDGWKDIVIGGWGNVLAWAENPGAHWYDAPWPVHIIDTTRWNHDVFAADMNNDGKIDIVTNQGIYFQSGDNTFTFVDIGRDQGNTDAPVGVGTAIGNMLNNGDGYNDVVGVHRDGDILKVAWYENPGHTNGNPQSDQWNVHFIDAYPGGAASNANAETMVLAVADLNADGKLDVVGAFQGEGITFTDSQMGDGLVCYCCPDDPRSQNWPKNVINADLCYIHTDSLKFADFNGDGHLDICYAQQEQSGAMPDPHGFVVDPLETVHQQMGIYYNSNGDGQSWTQQILSDAGEYASGGFNSLVGRVGADTLPSVITANHGYYGHGNPLVLWRNTCSGKSKTE
jgi:hypothetical protein